MSRIADNLALPAERNWRMKANDIDIQQMHYDNGQLWQKVPFLGETIHGVIREWHENGVLAFEIPMSNGLRHGVCKQWNEQVQLLGTYEMNMGTGISRRWHSNGQLQFEAHMTADTFDGPVRIWDVEGRLLHEWFHANGRKSLPPG